MNHQLWNQLLTIADNLNESTQPKQFTLKYLSEQLESIDVGYSRTFDPADNFEEYVMVTLCKAIQSQLNDK